MNKFADLIEDFDISIARVLVSGDDAIIDNVKRIIIMSEENITIDYGKGQLSLYGNEMTVDSIYDGRICVNGSFSGIEFFGKDRK
ncbi:MAG: hypothetical protein HFE90_05745 [Firmicutes bacterium]|nr:hypothetical protein [Bacillota bacterium]